MMNDDENLLDFQGDPGEDDEVEILEVVGIDDSPAARVPRTRNGKIGGPDAESGQAARDDDILLSFEEESSDAAVALVEAEPTVARVDEEALLRLQADYDNLRKRVDRERADFQAYATSTLVARLLPILDNFERAIDFKPSESSGGALHDGMVMVYSQLLEELRREGLCAIEAVGEVFDPNIHDAVSTDPDSDQPANTVIEEMQRGYLFQNRLLRPALVKVSVAGDGDINDTVDNDGKE